jgi:DNA repair exonuclease SbcCD ATPase subunit
MQLLRLEVRNWCQHKYRECSFTRGLVAIIGKIGSGKSNLLGAICWLLTGENPNNGLKMENVSQLAAEGEPSYAALEFEHAGHTVVVTRHLLPEKEPATLFVDGVEAARGDKAVTAHIERLLGIDSKFISRFVLVAQNEIFAFIEDGAAEVDKFFQKLFGTACAEKCHETINKQLNKLVVPEVPEPVTVLENQAAELSVKINALSVEINKLPTLSVFLEAQTSQQKILQDWQTRTKLAETLAGAERGLAECAGQLARVERDCGQYCADLTALTEVAEGAQDASAEAKAALNNLTAYRQLAAARTAAASRLAEIEAARAATQEPLRVSDAAVNELVNAAAALEIQLAERQKFVTTFDSGDVAECPTCHTPTVNLKTAVAEAKAQLAALSEQIAHSRQKIAAATAARAARLAWEKEEAKLAAEAQQLADSTATLDNFKAPDTDESALLRVIADHDKLQAAKIELEELAQKEKEKKANLAGRLENLTQQKEALLENISALAVTQADAALAQSTLDILSQQCVQRQSLEKQLAQVEFEYASLQERIATTRDMELQAALLREWSDTAVAAKDALKLAPRIVAKRNLQRLELAVNELLQIFGVDFLVRSSADDSPTFVAEFFDGRKQPAKRLSYGQKTVLALAFRVAVNALFAEQIGLLALDEPTAYLDQQRIKALAPVLERLRELSTARGLQCLMVTHETSLSHLFESAVELDA